MTSSDEVEPVQDARILKRRVLIGTAMVSILGTIFGVFMIVMGSFLIWRSDSVLGLYDQTGWRFDNLIAGDGKISVVLGTLAFIGLVLGFVLRRRAFYALTAVCSLLILALSIYELVFLFTRSGVVSPGAGVYMLTGGSAVGVLCGIAGYFMLVEIEKEAGDSTAAHA